VQSWIDGEPVTGISDFGNGYREALRDVTDVLKRPFRATSSPVPEQIYG
jgi:hypothetical protein